MLSTLDLAGFRHRTIIVLIAAALITLAVIGARFALSGRPSHPEPSTFTRSGLPGPSANRPTPGATPDDMAPLHSISEPQVFAEAVARALFDWDTTAPAPLTEHAGRLLAVADPTGAESNGLVSDLAGYLPTAQVWAQLKPYYTRQWIQIDSIAVPELWPQAEAEAGPGGFAPGTTAYTVEGVRHRAGVWDGENVSSEHDVSFSLFVVCGPTYPSCHLLRLSRLNAPLA